MTECQEKHRKEQEYPFYTGLKTTHSLGECQGNQRTDKERPFYTGLKNEGLDDRMSGKCGHRPGG